MTKGKSVVADNVFNRCNVHIHVGDTNQYEKEDTQKTSDYVSEKIEIIKKLRKYMEGNIKNELFGLVVRPDRKHSGYNHLIGYQISTNNENIKGKVQKISNDIQFFEEETFETFGYRYSFFIPIQKECMKDVGTRLKSSLGLELDLDKTMEWISK